jgi:hypothetical protein
MVTPALRAVTVGWDEEQISAICLFDGPLEEEEFEMCSDIESEVMASFPDREVHVVAKRLDAPHPLARQLLEAWVYCRKE